MIENIVKLTENLIKAGLPINGIDQTGRISWTRKAAEEEKLMADKMIAEHDPTQLPEPSHDEKIAALEAMVRRLSGDTKQTDEEIDLMVKTGLITAETAASMKAEA